jgi:peptidoglycan/xylan/chitin deacetylase (PgdA/CDA1 family)
MYDTRNPVDYLTSDGSVAVFLFHGVVESSDYQVRNYTKKHLLAGEFRRTLESLARKGMPLSMDEVSSICCSGQKFPPGAFAITFDDGFENNVSVARPILESLKIPAAVYVTSRFVDENLMSWTDRIEFALEHTKIRSCRLPWRDAPQGIGGRDDKIVLLDDIRREVKGNCVMNVEALIADIFAQLEIAPVTSSDDPLDKKMSWWQVRNWLAPGYVIGGHSHTHAILSFLSPAELAREINTSLELLRDRAGIVTSHYSYPEGLAHCYSPAVISALLGRGIACCPSAIEGVNPPGTDPFQLRRIMVA